MLKKFLALITILTSAATVSAADITVDCDIDYDNGIVNAECTTEAKYNQAISAILYEGTDDIIDPAKIIGIKDTDANADGKASFEFVFSDEQRGKYTLSVSGGGYINNSGKAVFTYIPKSELAAVLTEINSAGENNIKSVMENYSEIFTLPQNDEVYKQLLLIRKDDYSESFGLIEDVKNSLKLADKLCELNGKVTSTDVIDYIKTNAAFLGVDAENADFAAAEESAASIFIKLKSANRIMGRSSLKKLWAEAIAVSTINRTASDGMSAAITKYAAVLGLDLTSYTSACTAYSAVEVNKAFTNGNFNNKEEILAAYSKRIASLPSTNPNPGSGSSSSGGGSGSRVPSSSGVSTTIPSDETEKNVDFIDMNGAEWAAEKVRAMALKGIISGYEDQSFKPNKLVTREEFVTILVRAFGLYDEASSCEFEDVDAGAWYYKYVASAVSKRLASGTDENLFGTGSNITRQDAATMTYRAAKACGKEFVGNASEFSDSDDISSYAAEAVTSLAGSGILSGFEDGSFRPTETLTRAQAAVMIGNILN